MPSAARVRLATPLLVTLLAACGSDPLAPVTGTWSLVSAGDQFTCALTTIGDAYCWGAGIFGQLGNDQTTQQPVPAAVVGGVRFTTLSAGSDHVCAIARSDGQAWCWGLNDFGELGASTSFCNTTFQFVSCSRVPLAIKGTRFDSVVVAGYASCGLEPDGDTHCWGWNDHGQVGSGSVGSIVTAPAPIAGGRRFLALTMDIYHACGVTSARALFCWGSNEHGQLAVDTSVTPRCGIGTGFPCADAPVAAAPTVTAVSVSAGSTHTCALDQNGDAWCWGSNQYGALGNPTTNGGRVPVIVQAGIPFAALSAGERHTCALGDDGSAWCWGVNTDGQLGVASVAEACPSFGSAQPCRTSPIAVDGGHRFASISAGSAHTCALDLDGEIWCWGRGLQGQLGNGSQASSNAPLRVARP